MNEVITALMKWHDAIEKQHHRGIITHSEYVVCMNVCNNVGSMLNSVPTSIDALQKLESEYDKDCDS